MFLSMLDSCIKNANFGDEQNIVTRPSMHKVYDISEYLSSLIFMLNDE